MLKISLGFGLRFNCKLHRRWALAESPNLRKNEPHPVTRLAPAPKLRDNLLVYGVLCALKAIQIVRVVHKPNPSAFVNLIWPHPKAVTVSNSKNLYLYTLRRVDRRKALRRALSIGARTERLVR